MPSIAKLRQEMNRKHETEETEVNHFVWDLYASKAGHGAETFQGFCLLRPECRQMPLLCHTWHHSCDHLKLAATLRAAKLPFTMVTQ